MNLKLTRGRFFAAAAVLLVIAAAATFNFWWGQGSPEPSGPTLAPTLQVASPAPPTTPAVQSTKAPAPAGGADALDLEPAPTATPDPRPAVAAHSAEAVLYRIGTGGGTASFTVNEILYDEPYTAVGRTGEVAGDFIIDFGDPRASELGTIVVNARTFVTDSSFRDRAIRNAILQSSQDRYEFLSFSPTGLNGIPDQIAIGQTIEIEIVGDLTIRDITLPTTWLASVTIESEQQISARADTRVLRSDFGLEIPSVPAVAGVDDEVALTIEFSAQRIEQ